MTIVDMWERMKKAQEVIRELCKAGYIDEAWALLNESPGKVRDAQLRAFFAFAEKYRGQDEMLSRIESLGSEGFIGEQEVALEGLIEGIDKKEMGDLFGNPVFQQLFNQFKREPKGELWMQGMIGNNLRMRLENGDDPHGVLDIARNAHGLGLLDDPQLMRVLNSASDLDAFERFKISNDLVENPGESKEWRSALVKQLISQDPVRSMNLLADSVKSSSDFDFSEGLRYWNYADPAVAVEWFANNRNHLTGGKADVAAGTFSDSAINSRSREIAMEWADEIGDPILKKEQIEKIARAFDIAQVEGE